VTEKTAALNPAITAALGLLYVEERAAIEAADVADGRTNACPYRSVIVPGNGRISKTGVWRQDIERAGNHARPTAVVMGTFFPENILWLAS
jgi:hypothetical protein